MTAELLRFSEAVARLDRTLKLVITERLRLQRLPDAKKYRHKKRYERMMRRGKHGK